jgi:hypothetical protein
MSAIHRWNACASSIASQYLDDFYTTWSGLLLRASERTPQQQTPDWLTVAEQLPIVRNTASALPRGVERG